MLDNWLPFLIYAIFALAVPAGMMFASFALSTRPHRRVRARTIPFESGVSMGPPQAIAALKEAGLLVERRAGTFVYLTVGHEALAALARSQVIERILVRLGQQLAELERQAPASAIASIGRYMVAAFLCAEQPA